MKKRIDFSSGAVRHYASVIACVLFILVLMLMVLGQADTADFTFSHSGKYMRTMLFIAVAVALAGGWDFCAQAHMTGMICSLGMLAAMGTSYQVIFPGGFGSYCISMLLSAVTCVVFYHFQRRVITIPHALYYILAGASVVLMVALLKFGSVENNALLGIEIKKGQYFRPAEFVKVLIIFLGAHAYRNRLRQITFCIISLVCCLLCVKCDDLGAAVIIFANFVIMSYLLFDSRIFSSALVVAAVAGLWFVLTYTHYGINAKDRMEQTFHAMDLLDSHQRGFIRAVIYGGFTGLGLEHTGLISNIYAIHNDGAMAGLAAIYGIPMLLVTMLAYCVLTITPAYNRSLTPMGYLLLTQMTTYVFCHGILALLGPMDCAPFTGIVCPILSSGINAFVAFGMLIGLSAGAMHPADVYVKE